MLKVVETEDPQTVRIRALEAQLREARAFSDALYRGVSSAIFVVDVDSQGEFRYAELSRSHEDATGLHDGAVRGKRPVDLVPHVLTAAHAASVTANYQRCVDARAPIEYEEYIEFGGRPGWWITRLTPLADAGGGIGRIVGNSWDITARKQLEADGEARQRRFRAVFELSVEAKFLADDHGGYLDVNGAAGRLLDYTSEELATLSVFDMVPDSQREDAQAMWREFLQRGHLSGEIWLRRKDGSMVPVEFEAVANVVEGVHLVVCRDLTARKAAEADADRARIALEQAHARLDGMIEALPQPMCAFDREGRIIACNAAYIREFRRLYGMAVGPGDSVIERIRHVPQDLERSQSLLVRVFNGESISLATEYGDPALGRHLYRVSLSPIHGPDGTVDGASFMAEDVTERTRAESALRDSEARLRDMAANIPGVLYQWVERTNGERGFRWVSPRLKDVFGIDPADAHRIAEYIHPDDRERWIRSIDEANRTGAIWNFEGRMMFPDGSIRWWEGISRQSKVTDEEIVYNGVVLDITDRKLAEDELRLAAKVFEASRVGIMIMDPERCVLSVNRAFTAITGFRPEEVLGRMPRQLESDRHDQHYYRAMWRRPRAGGAWEGEVWLRRRDGFPFPARVQVMAVVSDGGEITHYIGIFEDISERKAQEERIRHMAQHDFLTGLPNRALLEDRLHQAMPLALRNGTRLAVLFLDLDRFKLINDSLGHDVGDRLLQQVSRRLAGCVRAADTVSRQGGDEFVLLLQDLDAPEQAAAVARKILEVISEPFVVDGTQLSVTPSIGISVFPDDAPDSAPLLRNADAAMYHAKGVGRNNYQFFTRDMNARVIERVEIEARLRRAIAGEEFSLHFQPRIDLADNAVIGVEALLRWNDPDFGMVAPSTFIPIAEESGLILQIGEWVLNAACRQARRWQELGLPPFPVSVNLSAVQFRQRGLEHVVADALKATGLEPTFLELEVTETSIMHDIAEVRGTLDRLKAFGVTLSVDDFGTGYSSLGYLKRLPLDRLKIDRSFVKDVTEDADDAAITAAIVAMARTLGLKTIAEGVETEAQLAFLKKLGCEEGQGYYFSRPLPPEALADFVRKRTAR